MSQLDLLAAQFEGHRARLTAVAYRMLGSRSDADDAVQETWLRLSRAGSEEVVDLTAWLTTVVARICLDALRARSRRATPVDPFVPDPVIASTDAVNPEEELVMADSVGLALLVVLEQLAPAERLAFVLHDIFDVPFEQVAAVIGRSEPATRQVASRARRRVRTVNARSFEDARADVSGQWEVVDAFIEAARNGDFEALVRVLDPAVVRRLDCGPLDLGVPRVLCGAEAVASGAIGFQRLGGQVRRVLVNGVPGLVTLLAGEPFAVLGFTISRRRITELNVLADPLRLSRLDLSPATT